MWSGTSMSKVLTCPDDAYRESGQCSNPVWADMSVQLMPPLTAAEGVKIGMAIVLAPTQAVAVVRLNREGERQFRLMRWGLLPTFVTDPKRFPTLINARSETVERRPSFAESFRRRRCWVLADGFYEWRSEDGARVPYHIRLPGGRPFAFAGIWDRAEGRGGPVVSCAILTTRPAPAVAPIHDRMPVLLPAEARDAWLDPSTDLARLRALMAPYAGALEVTRVSARVNAVTNDDAACREPDPAPAETSRP